MLFVDDVRPVALAGLDVVVGGVGDEAEASRPETPAAKNGRNEIAYSSYERNP